ncbi:MFS transporter [Massilia atriviolacea]|uniref:MFS transporter n=1 Tax=Massilia atriviolacea TaxID=2495579 RepID=A0A430HCN7_9BURK|nr:MFS transporter [Massilia atriviolacea]RSZ55270.1 MFS transporter [Massilia atriviolacea]
MKQVLRRDRELYARPVRLLCAFILGVMLLTQAALAAYAWSLSGQRFLPALEQKALTIAEALAQRQARAIGQGAPLPAGGPAWDAILAQHPDIAYITLTDAAGKVLYRGGKGAEVVAPEDHLDTRADIVHRFARHGQVHVGVARGYVQSRMSALRPELAVLLVASLLIAFEALWFILTVHCSAPVRQVIAVMSRMAAGDFRFRAGDAQADGLEARLDRLEARINAGFREVVRRAGAPGQQALGAIVLRRLRARYRFSEDADSAQLARQRIAGVRILAFLCVFSALLVQPVLPQHAVGAGLPGAALPAGAGLLALALALPWAARWSDRAGRRRAFVAGAVGAAAALACAAFAPDLAALALARAAGGAGVALMLTTCHGHVHDHADSGATARGLSMLAGGAALAACCAPAAGALLADHLGVGGAYLAAAGTALLAGAVAGFVLDPRGARPRTADGRRRLLAAAALPCAALLTVIVPSATALRDGAGPWPWLSGLAAALLITLFARAGRMPRRVS